MSILYPIKDEIELTDSYSRYSNQCIADEYKSYWILSSHHLEQLECQKIMINRALGVSDEYIETTEHFNYPKAKIELERLLNYEQKNN